MAEVDLAVAEGEIAAVIGPNGAGKSTLFNLITGHLRPTSGQVFVDGRDITGVAPHRICGMGHRALVPAHQHLSEAHRVRERAGGLARPSRPRRGFLVALRTAFAAGKPSAARLDRPRRQALAVAGTLSYGNQKQLELGIALASDPKILLLDEPTAGMSASETHETMALLARIARERGLTLLFTEHDMAVVFSIAHKIAVMHQGRVIAAWRPGVGACRCRGAAHLSRRRAGGARS